MATIPTQVRVPSATVDLITTASVGKPRGTTLQRPAKFLLGGLTPAADQRFRGDCWPPLGVAMRSTAARVAEKVGE